MKRFLENNFGIILVVVLFSALCLVVWETSSRAGTNALKKIKAERIRDVGQLSGEEVREQNYWAAENESMFDLKLYLEDWGCKEIQIKNPRKRDGVEMRYTFWKGHDLCELTTVVPMETDWTDKTWSFGVACSTLRIFSPDGVYETIPKYQYAHLDSLIYDSSAELFATNRAVLGQLFATLQYGTDEAVLSKFGIAKIQ